MATRRVMRLPAAVRVVNGVHRHAPGLRPASLVAGRPALPSLMFWCSALESEPTVARQSARTIRISVEGRRRVTLVPSLAATWIPEPAARPRRPPWPGTSSTLWTIVPVGIERNGSALPGRMSAPSPD